MNLFDLIKRRDRNTSFDADLVKSAELRIGENLERCVSIAPSGRITVNRAHEITCLASAPQVLGWQVISLLGEAEVNFSVQSEGRVNQGASLGCTKVTVGDCPKRVLLNWPTWVGDDLGYSFTIDNHGDAEAIIVVGPNFSSRSNLLSELNGDGVEVGPGANPCVKPSATVNVKYVETMPAEEWALVYGKRVSDEQMTTLWKNYVVASAHQLETFVDESLDFIFSNHVFEHLVNPLGVLRNWHKKLKPNGVIVAVIPDARFTFDLRQPVSILEECIEELNSGDFSLRPRHYEKWCRFTAPYNTPEQLIQRKYSVHAKYYTPESFRQLAEFSMSELKWSGIFIQSTLNGKDFGIRLKKRGVN